MTAAAPSISSIVRTKKAVIFDLFHTLTPVESSWSQPLPYTHEMLGVSRAAWNEQLFECSRDRLAGLQTDGFAIIAGMARAIDPTITDGTIRKATANRVARFAAALERITPETRGVIQTLRQRRLRIGLISNADVMEVTAWPRCPIADLFDSTIFSCYVGHVKPESAIYRLSLDQLGVAPSEAVFVGDGGSNELQGAKGLVITTVFITAVMSEIWPEKIPERTRLADFTIERLDELISG
jgi:putative hydrolase of the HAD superfamily